MELKIKGKIIFSLPKVEGISKAGNAWKKKEYVLETDDTYPRKVFFNFFGDRADQFPLEIGQEIILTCEAESREYNGRWYTDIRGLKAEAVSDAAAPADNFAPAASPFVAPAGPTQPADVDPFSGSPDSTDDLPF